MSGSRTFETVYRDNIILVRKIIASFKITNGTADDLAQQTFLQAFEKYSTLRDAKLLKPWIASIARNFCLDHFRSQKLVHEDLSLINEYKLGLWIDPESGEADLELERNLYFLQQLLTEYKKEPRGTVARLYYLDGLTTRQISEQLSMTQNTVLSHLLLFRREVKAALIVLAKKSATKRPD